MNVAFIINSTIRRPNKAHAQIDIFKKSGVADTVSVFETESAMHAIQLAKDACEDHDLLVAIGGDGTINEVLNGIMLSGKDRILTAMPYGTANDLSRTLHWSREAEDLIDLVNHQTTAKIDIGSVKFLNNSADEDHRYFINEIDFGLGGYVVEQVANSNKPLGPKYSFLRAILQGLVIYDQSEVIINADDYNWSGKLLSLTVSNGRFFGSGLEVASEASMSDGIFDVALFSNIKTIDYFKYIRKLRRGVPIDDPKIIYKKAKRVSIEPVDLSCAIDMDGEFCGFTPATVEIIPKALNILTKNVSA